MHKQKQHEYDAMLANARMWKGVEQLLREDIRKPIADFPQLLRQLSGANNLTPQQQELIAKLELNTSHSLNAIARTTSLFDPATADENSNITPAS
jgi:Fic family protein